jgi:hypothetical protein
MPSGCASTPEKRGGKGVAVLALEGKLAGILFAIWRDDTVYEPRRSGAIRSGRTPTKSSQCDACPATAIAVIATRAGRPRKTDCENQSTRCDSGKREARFIMLWP